MKPCLPLWALAVFSLPCLATDEHDEKAFLSFPNMSVFESARNDHARIRLVSGRVSYRDSDTETHSRGYLAERIIEVTGDHVRIVADYPHRASSTGVLDLVSQRIASAGFSELYRCEGVLCGETRGWRALVSEFVAGADDSQAYVLAVREARGRRQYAGLYINEIDDQPRVVADFIEDVTPTADLVRSNVSYVEEAFEAGAKFLGAVPFQTGSSTAEPLPIELAERIRLWLAGGGGKIILVGYTDSTGSLALNHDLALRRAGFIRNYLSGAFDIPIDRLEVRAVGPVSPSGYRPAFARSVEAWGR